MRCVPRLPATRCCAPATAIDARENQMKSNQIKSHGSIVWKPTAGISAPDDFVKSCPKCSGKVLSCRTRPMVGRGEISCHQYSKLPESGQIFDHEQTRFTIQGCQISPETMAVPHRAHTASNHKRSIEQAFNIQPQTTPSLTLSNQRSPTKKSAKGI